MSKSKEAGTAGNVILKYLNEQNRPYSAQDVFSNLQREHGLGKTVVVKAMELLAQQGKIKEKVYGKQKIYFANQDQFCSVSDADLKDLDSKIAELSGELQTSQQSVRQLESELKDLTSSMTTEELVKETAKLKEECAGSQSKLEKIKSATDHVTPEEKEKVYNERKQFCKEWRKRKRMAVEIFDAILEGYPKSKKQFFEEVGVETDEDHNVTVPDV